MAKETKDMTLEDALNLLKGDVLDLSRRKADEAMAIVRASSPDHPLLKKAQNEIDAFQKAVNEALLYRKNLDTITEVADKIDYESFINDEMNERDLKPLVDEGIDIIGENGEILDQENKKEHFKRVYYTAREKTIADLVENSSGKAFSAPTAEEIKAEIKPIFYGDLASIITAHKMPKPQGKEKSFGSDEYFQFIRKQAEKAREVFENLLSKGKIFVKSDYFLASAVDGIDGVDKHLQQVRQKLHSKYVQKSEEAKEAYTYAAARWQKAKNHLIKKAKALWGNRYVIMHEIKNGFKDNKFKVMGDVTVSVGTALWMSAGAASAAATGATVAPVITAAAVTYAAYHAAGSWVWPVVAEMRKINREKRENGEKTLAFKNQLKQAWKNITGNKNRCRTYAISGVLNTVAAPFIPMIVHHAAQGLDVARNLGDAAGTGLNVSLAQNISQIRQTTILSHLGTVVSSGAVDAATDRVMAGFTKDEKEKILLKKSAKRKAGSVIVTATVGLGAQALGFALGKHAAAAQDTVLHDASTAHDYLTLQNNTFVADADSLSNQPIADSLRMSHTLQRDSLFVDSSRVDSLQFMEQDSLSTGNIDGTDALDISAANTTGTDVVDVSSPDSLVPTQWHKDMGISQGQFNTLMSTTEGTLSGDNPNITLERAYTNLDQVMDKFDGMTKEQVLYKVNRLYAFFRKAVPVGDGTFREAPSGEAYLTSRFASMKLGLDENAMFNLVDLAQEHTYDTKAEIVNVLKEHFGDQFNGAQVNKMASIIVSNQRFYQHGQEMEALLKALGCGEGILTQDSELSEEMANKVNALLQSTNTLLKTGTKNVALTGLNLEDCHQDGGEWREVAKALRQSAQEDQSVPSGLNESVIERSEPVQTPPEVRAIPDENLKLRPVGKATIDHFDQLVGKEKPLWEKHLYDTPLSKPAHLENIPTGTNEAVRNASQGRTIEEVSVSSFKQMTGQENADATRATYSTHTSGKSSTFQPVSEQQVQTTDGHEVTSGVKARKIVRGSAHNAAQLLGQQKLDQER